MNDLFSLEQKVAIVTGGNGGIGKGIARGFASMGADVAIVARNSQKTESAVKEIQQEFGVRALGLLFDVTEEKAVQQMAEEVRRDRPGPPARFHPAEYGFCRRRRRPRGPEKGGRRVRRNRC